MRAQGVGDVIIQSLSSSSSSSFSLTVYNFDGELVECTARRRVGDGDDKVVVQREWESERRGRAVSVESAAVLNFGRVTSSMSFSWPLLLSLSKTG